MKKYDFSMKKTPPPSFFYKTFVKKRSGGQKNTLLFLQDFCKNAQWRAKKHPPFLQDFCKNAQWRAKKLRERGSSTARPTEKGIGGLPIRSRFGRFGASIRSISARRADLECCLCRDSVDSVESCRVEVKAQTQKKPDSSIGESGSAIARRRALLTFR